jgi:hypothetical protein
MHMTISVAMYAEVKWQILADFKTMVDSGKGHHHYVQESV